MSNKENPLDARVQAQAVADSFTASRARLDADQRQLADAWFQNKCGDEGCERLRLNAALKVLRGAEGGTHRHYADKVNQEGEAAPAQQERKQP
jgi:hypothetical protein